MKAKVYVPIIIGAGAVAGIILGVVNIGSHPNKNDTAQTIVAQETTTTETTLSEEEKKKLEDEKRKEYEEKEKKEEQNASDKLKKKDEEKKKKQEEEEKKKQEEEEKKKQEEEEKKNTESEGNKKENEKNEDDEEYEYIYVPVNENSGQSYSGSDNQTTQPQSQHEHTWKKVYKTVHHDAVTHKENRYAGTVDYNECIRNGEHIFDVTTKYGLNDFYQVCKRSDGSVVFQTYNENEKKEIGYFLSLFNIPADDQSYSISAKVEELTDEVTVTDKEAYDEYVFDHEVCTVCGITR